MTRWKCGRCRLVLRSERPIRCPTCGQPLTELTEPGTDEVRADLTMVTADVFLRHLAVATPLADQLVQQLTHHPSKPYERALALSMALMIFCKAHKWKPVEIITTLQDLGGTPG